LLGGFRLSRGQNALALRLLMKSSVINNEPNISEKHLRGVRKQLKATNLISAEKDLYFNSQNVES
jgi:hypothetical protein